jgi:hypothetical protein
MIDWDKNYEDSITELKNRMVIFKEIELSQDDALPNKIIQFKAQRQTQNGISITVTDIQIQLYFLDNDFKYLSYII